MAESPRKRDGWMVVLYTLLLVAGLVLMAMGILELYQKGDGVLLGLGVLAVMIPAALYPVAAGLRPQAPSAGDPQVLDTLKLISERLLISDAAKGIAYREQDRNALRQAIREDMARSDYDAALVLVEEMASRYGYREEAEQFREEILAARKAEIDAKVDQAMVRLDAILDKRQWDDATAEAAKIMRLYPDVPRVAALAQRVRETQAQYKKDLELRFLKAAERNDIDVAMDLLKEMDLYLSRTEAEELREVARGVVVKKRENLGVQFKLAVHDKEWTESVRIGEQIIKEFPNTRMAGEVRQMIDLLRQRAGSQQAARTTAVTE